jgi:hypothetical protein
VPGGRVLELLPGGGEQLLGPGVVGSGSAGCAEGEVDLGPQRKRACFPYRVAGTAKQRQAAHKVGKRILVPPEVVAYGGTPQQNPASEYAARLSGRLVEFRQSLSAATRPGEGDPEGGPDVGLAVGIPGVSGQP